MLFFCSFPSNDFAFPREGRPPALTTGIWTTDRTGRAGDNPNPETGAIEGDADLKYTNSFGGTSSACPGAAGVAALVLSRSPELRREEVKDILRRCCDKIDPQAGQYDANGHSKLYGFGRLNAETAVRLARPETPVAAARVEKSFDVPIADFATARVTLEVAENTPIEALGVALEIEHTFIGDLVVTLVPPPAMSTARIVLHRRTGGRTKDLKRTFSAVTTPALANLSGKTPKGTWTLEVKDEARGDTGVIRKLALDFRFPQEPPVRTAPKEPAARGTRAAAKRRS
jgi:subtilisin-like proprotein convertase family protein